MKIKIFLLKKTNEIKISFINDSRIDMYIEKPIYGGNLYPILFGNNRKTDDSNGVYKHVSVLIPVKKENYILIRPGDTYNFHLKIDRLFIRKLPKRRFYIKMIFSPINETNRADILNKDVESNEIAI